MYKARTFRLRSYKAYIRMINIPIIGRNKAMVSASSQMIQKEWAHSQRPPESQGLGIGETIAGGDNWTKGIARFQCCH